MEPIFRIPASPGTPLFPVSPDRVNRQQLPHSPSRQSDLSFLQDEPFKTYHSRNSSDVQGKVAQFNNLSKEASQRRKDNEAALKRAVVGREEAESETRRLKDETRSLRKEVEEGILRERRVGERMETVMEEMQRLKETQAHSQALYEKEVRRARKEAFKSSSALVKLQEELKTTRNKFTLMREDAETYKRKLESRDQETFTAQYQLVGLQEELEAVRQQVKIVEEERDLLKENLKEEEVARIAAEGKISLPPSIENDEFSSPRKSRRESGKENMDPIRYESEDDGDELTRLKLELTREKRRGIKAVRLIDFMKVECQFNRCSCHIAARQSKDSSHSHNDKAQTRPIEQEEASDGDNLQDTPITPAQASNRTTAQHEDHDQPVVDSEPLIEFSPTTGTFRTVPSPMRDSPSELPTPSRLFSEESAFLAPPLNPTALSESPSFLSLGANPLQPAISTEQQLLDLPQDSSPNMATVPHPESTPYTPRTPAQHLPFRPQTAGPSRIISTTTTTTIPLADPYTPAKMPYSPGANTLPYSPASTMTREQALEQIRQRRGRARSIAAGNGTPRKPMFDARRDISAPTVGSAKRHRIGAQCS
ncbi:hypothetical protein MMC26_004235 [Xylographa opegraphella]|nr:hypothetical protein [Xylographa opegraphella]